MLRTTHGLIYIRNTIKKVAYAFTYNNPDQDGKHDTYGLSLNGADPLSKIRDIQSLREHNIIKGGHNRGLCKMEL